MGKKNKQDVATTCVGLAASMGAFLLSAGHQGKRYTLPNSRIMIHQPLGGAQGQAADIEIQVRGLCISLGVRAKFRAKSRVRVARVRAKLGLRGVVGLRGLGLGLGLRGLGLGLGLGLG